MSWISAPWHFNKSEVHARAGARHKVPFRSHIQLGRPPSCVGGNTFMTVCPALHCDDKCGKNSHNSLLDTNDLWHLRSKSLQLPSAADLRHSSRIMSNMKDTSVWFKMPLKLPACSINLRVGSMTKKHCLPLCTSLQKQVYCSRTEIYTTSALQRAVFKWKWRQIIITHWVSGNVTGRLSLGSRVETTEVAHSHHVVGFGTTHPLITNDIRQIVVICTARVGPTQWFVLICRMFYWTPSLICLN